jgi:hypothetical protein
MELVTTNIMEQQILSNLDNPAQLERLYRSDKPTFKKAFRSLHPQVSDNTLVSYWNERLNFSGDEISWGTWKDLRFILIASFIAGLIAKVPTIIDLDEEYFYSRNVSFIFFPALCAYFASKNNLGAGKKLFIASVFLVSFIYINLLPADVMSDTVILSCIHLVLFLWSLTGFAYVGSYKDTNERRLGFLKYNGDLAVMCALVVISGIILSAITIGLFRLIHIDIEDLYLEYVAVFGLAATPIVSTYLIQTNPQLVGKVSPLIARIFSPIVLVMLVIYLIAIIASGKDPYNDREFLLIFNSLLIGVMAIIFFSVAEASDKSNSMEIAVLFMLSAVTVILNGIALSAILFRISEWGITPNRAAVLGSNVLMLGNLLLVTGKLFQTMRNKKDVSLVGNVIASYLPAYIVWVGIVSFVFPFLFGFK